jgi:hypothetical protein
VRVVFDQGERVEPALYLDLEGTFTFTDAVGKSHDVGEEVTALGDLSESPVSRSTASRRPMACSSWSSRTGALSAASRIRSTRHGKSLAVIHFTS